MNAQNEEEQIKKLLRQAMPPVDTLAGEVPDLWPEMLRRLHRGHPPGKPAWAWFDCTLLAGLVGAVALFPAALPLLLYYL